MHFDEQDDEFLMDVSAAEVDADCGGSIGIFSRTQRLPSDCVDENEAAEILAQLERDNPRLHEIVQHHIERERAEAERDVMMHFSSLVTRLFAWAVVPQPCQSKIWGLIFALDLEGLHGGVGPAVIARRYGLSRAAISVQMRQAAVMMSLAPSRWMRSESTAVASTTARKKFVNQATTTAAA